MPGAPIAARWVREGDVILAKLGVGMLCVTVTAGSLALSEGLVHVRVIEKKPQGMHLFLVAPGVLAPAAIFCVPSRHLQKASEQLQPWMPAIRAAVDELKDERDMTFVEVVEQGQHVRVSKSGGSVIVDVDDPNDTVHVSAPLRVIGSTIEELASKSADLAVAPVAQ
jgi:hypothetical protein